jgi:hypothetical protein
MRRDQQGDMVAERQPRERPRRRHAVLWWVYLILFVALFGVTLVNHIAEGFFRSFGAALPSGALLSVDAICIAGLYAYIRSTALFVPAFWRFMLALLLAKIFVAASFLLPGLIPWESAPEQYVALAGLLTILLTIPMLAALWCYGFKSPHIWRVAAASK